MEIKQTLSQVAIALFFSFCFIGIGGFLCLFTVRDRVRRPWWLLVLVVLGETVLYYGFRHVSWLGVLPFLLVAFLSYGGP